MPIYSFSQIQKYLSCPLSYKFRYVDKIVPEFEENLHLILWTEVHSALEWLYNQVNNFKIPKIEELEAVFVEKFDEKAKNLENEDEEKKEFLHRWKYYLQSFYKKHYPFDDIKVIWTEIKLLIDLDEKIKFQWFIDRLDKKWEDFILTDYKTNKNLPPEDKTYYEEQLTLYALWVKQKYWKYLKKVYWNLEYLHFELQDFWEITDENIEKVRQKYIDIVYEIEQKKAEYNLWNEQAFPTNETSNCRFCDYKDICPLFSQIFWKVNYKDLWEDTIKAIVDDYVKLSKQKSEIEKQLKQNKEILEEFVKENKLEQIYWNEHSIKVSKLVNYKILDKEKLKKFLEEKNLLDQVLELDRFKLKKLLEGTELNLGTGLCQRQETLVFRGK